MCHEGRKGERELWVFVYRLMIWFQVQSQGEDGDRRGLSGSAPNHVVVQELVGTPPKVIKHEGIGTPQQVGTVGIPWKYYHSDQGRRSRERGGAAAEPDFPKRHGDEEFIWKFLKHFALLAHIVVFSITLRTDVVHNFPIQRLVSMSHAQWDHIKASVNEIRLWWLPTRFLLYDGVQGFLAVLTVSLNIYNNFYGLVPI